MFFFRAYLKPLLRLLKKQTVTDDVMDSLVKMVVFCLQRDYILSHEKYMEMAVGNAPWPIGVTNAGIHARPARENILSRPWNVDGFACNSRLAHCLCY